MTGWVQAMAGAESAVVAEAETDVQPRTRPSQGDPVNDWLCAWCLNRVANEKDQFARNGRSEFRFTNPQGVWFTILTFSRTLGCREAGEPTLEHTWFAGHAWSYCVCARCGTHLGWYYAGPSRFVGLIRNRIIRAVGVMN